MTSGAGEIQRAIDLIEQREALVLSPTGKRNYPRADGGAARFHAAHPRPHDETPAQLDALYALARARGLTLPGDYVEFMSASDGGEGDVGNGYVELWPVHKTLEVADRYSVYEDFLAFAGDGGNTIYGFDLRASGEAVEGDWIGLERHELIRHGRTLTELLRAVATT